MLTVKDGLKIKDYKFILYDENNNPLCDILIPNIEKSKDKKMYLNELFFYQDALNKLCDGIEKILISYIGEKEYKENYLTYYIKEKK